MMDYQIVNHERRVYNFFDMVSDIGGVYEVIKTLMLIIMSTYTSKMYHFYTVNNINHRYLEPNKKFQKTHKDFLKSVYTKDGGSNRRIQNFNMGSPMQMLSCKNKDIPKIKKRQKPPELVKFNILGRDVVANLENNHTLDANKFEPTYFQNMQDKKSEESSIDSLNQSIYNEEGNDDRIQLKFSYKMLVYSMIWIPRWK